MRETNKQVSEYAVRLDNAMSSLEENKKLLEEYTQKVREYRQELDSYKQAQNKPLEAK